MIYTPIVFAGLFVSSMQCITAKKYVMLTSSAKQEAKHHSCMNGHESTIEYLRNAGIDLHTNMRSRYALWTVKGLASNQTKDSKPPLLLPHARTFEITVVF
ncbi:uncharacterized protein F4812DRAFT_410596 [Daldinia caldariorum]|uniref:uncharacterized protein n=1 Tax=Daldinia caldariorum TaxID=326644 RepID=UPI00200729B0|nr:uncharacterized protein F4812DRAFT_410596 [Daldinia caldariorum]KAI1472860.1 hypothetical protein F4812DRAFT_410596 [Daldinia caldariorum]